MKTKKIAPKKLTPHLSDKQMREWLDQSKLLRDCKRYGFKRLESAGHLKGGIKLSKDKAAPKHTPLEFAQRASKMVNDGMRISEAANEFGRSPSDLRYYCNKFGITLNWKFKRKEWDHVATYRRIRRFLNERGYNIKDTAAKIKCSPKLIKTIIAAQGRFYNVKNKKIERIKKS